MLAYLDAGSASAIVTLILGGIAGVGVAIKYRWHRLLVFLRIRKEDAQPAAPSEAAEPREPAQR